MSSSPSSFNHLQRFYFCFTIDWDPFFREQGSQKYRAAHFERWEMLEGVLVLNHSTNRLIPDHHHPESSATAPPASSVSIIISFSGVASFAVRRWFASSYPIIVDGTVEVVVEEVCCPFPSPREMTLSSPIIISISEIIIGRGDLTELCDETSPLSRF